MSPSPQKRIAPTSMLFGALLLLPLTACSGGASDGAEPEECVPAHEFETINPGELTVATYDYPPMTIVEGSALSGVEGDILELIAERECLTLTIDAAGGASASIPAIETGRADLAAGDWYRTKERAKITRLSEPLYIDTAAVVSKQDLQIEDLEGVTVGSVAGMLWNESFQKWLGDDFKLYQDDEALYQDLAAGRIDAIIANLAVTNERFKDTPIEGAYVNPLTPFDKVPETKKQGQANFPSMKDNEALGEALDANIIAMREDGTIAEILEKWGLDASQAEVGEPFDL